jgi:hypothetical protein
VTPAPAVMPASAVMPAPAATPVDPVTDVTRRADHDGGAGLLEVALRELQRRRRDRWLVAAVLVLAVIAAFAVLLVEGLAVATSPWIAVGFLAVTLLYVASVVFQEDRSRRAVRALVEERERLAAADEQVPPLEVLHEVLCAAGAAGPLPDVLAELLGGATTLTGATRGALALHDGEVLTVVAAAGPGAPPVGARLPEDDGATWRAIRAGSIVETGRGSEWGMVADASALAVPLAGEVAGALVVERAADGGGFAAEERLAASVLALQAALAVREATYLERLAEQAAALDEARQERDAALEAVNATEDAARNAGNAPGNATAPDAENAARIAGNDHGYAAVPDAENAADLDAGNAARNDPGNAAALGAGNAADLDAGNAARIAENDAENAADLDAGNAARIAENDPGNAAALAGENDAVVVRTDDLRDLVDRLHGLSASVTGTVQLLLHRGEGFPLARRQALLDDVLRKTSRQRELLAELEELASVDRPGTEPGSGVSEVGSQRMRSGM